MEMIQPHASPRYDEVHCHPLVQVTTLCWQDGRGAVGQLVANRVGRVCCLHMFSYSAEINRHQMVCCSVLTDQQFGVAPLGKKLCCGLARRALQPVQPGAGQALQRRVGRAVVAPLQAGPRTVAHLHRNEIKQWRHLTTMEVMGVKSVQHCNFFFVDK